MSLEQAMQKFKDLFQETPTATFFAPGRVNLIGEHIDYNGGLVFPCAISQGTYAFVSKREDNLFQAYSMNFESLGLVSFSLDDLSFNPKHEWCNYIKGVLETLQEQNHEITCGLNLVVLGTLPNGSGLSSSASLEVLMCKLCSDLYELNLDPVQMALIGKYVENHYIGVNSGIMDQFAIALGEKNKALLLDCALQKYQYIPLELDGYKLIIMNTNKRRELADSKYNERFAECQEALAILKKHYTIEHLCDLPSQELDHIKGYLQNDTLYKRVKHVITENERVITAHKVLFDKNLKTFGELLTASHVSLKDDYCVTGKALDTLVEAALNAGAIGARMTGAGFGGCAISLVPEEKIDSFIEQVGKQYQEVMGYAASFYIATANAGPIRLA